MSEHVQDNGRPGPNDDWMIALVRLVLAASALVIIYIDPSEPDRFVLATYLALILYTVYSAVLFVLVVGPVRVPALLRLHSHWFDVAWYVLLIALSSGTGSIFFFFFFFAILNASFGRGFRTGLGVTLVSSAAFTLVGYLTSPGGEAFELNRFLLRPIYLTVLGYMMAYWGGHEIEVKRRLALLRELSAVSNPRFGADRTVRTAVDLIRGFYDAGECLLILRDEETGETVYHGSGHGGHDSKSRARPLNPLLEKCLADLPADCAAISGGRWRAAGSYARDLSGAPGSVPEAEALKAIAERLDARSFLTVPVRHRRETVGRVFVLSDKKGVFGPADVDFLTQAVEQFMPTVENIRLIDRMASSAAEDERRKIARDIHDSIVQPYIGLQYGIDSVIQYLGEEEDEESEHLDTVRRRVGRLREMTEKGVEDLRGYISGLSKPRGLDGNLLPALRRFADTYTRSTGIRVEISAPEKFELPDRLAAEFFQIVVEGLSNIRRHTDSTAAAVTLQGSGDKILLAIENDSADNDGVGFTPRSITERVGMLGGNIDIEQKQGRTAVRIEVPL